MHRPGYGIGGRTEEGSRGLGTKYAKKPCSEGRSGAVGGQINSAGSWRPLAGMVREDPRGGEYLSVTVPGEPPRPRKRGVEGSPCAKCQAQGAFDATGAKRYYGRIAGMGKRE